MAQKLSNILLMRLDRAVPFSGVGIGEGVAWRAPDEELQRRPAKLRRCIAIISANGVASLCSTRALQGAVCTCETRAPSDGADTARCPRCPAPLLLLLLLPPAPAGTGCPSSRTRPRSSFIPCSG